MPTPSYSTARYVDRGVIALAVLVVAGCSSGAASLPTSVGSASPSAIATTGKASAVPSKVDVIATGESSNSAKIQLRSDAVGSVPFGEPAKSAEAKLIAMIGSPTEIKDGEECPLVDPSGTRRVLIWPGLAVTLGTADENGVANRPLRLEAWSVDQPPPSNAELATGMPWTVSWTELAQRNPAVTPSLGGVNGDILIADVDGLTVSSAPDAKGPQFFHAGVSVPCE